MNPSPAPKFCTTTKTKAWRAWASTYEESSPQTEQSLRGVWVSGGGASARTYFKYTTWSSLSSSAAWKARQQALQLKFQWAHATTLDTIQHDWWDTYHMSWNACYELPNSIMTGAIQTMIGENITHVIPCGVKYIPPVVKCMLRVVKYIPRVVNVILRVAKYMQTTVWNKKYHSKLIIGYRCSWLLPSRQQGDIRCCGVVPNTFIAPLNVAYMFRLRYDTNHENKSSRYVFRWLSDFVR